MYGQAGIILGGKGAAPASAIISPGCSPGSSHSASGRGRTPRAWPGSSATVGHKLFKQPVRADRFKSDKAFHEVLAGIDNRTTLLLDHTRRRTRGDEKINENNRSIRAGDILGTYNGTIYNANTLFRRFKLHRFAEVDSELLFRLAARAGRNGRIDVERFKGRLKLCRGQMAAVMASRPDPETTLVLKGNKPLELRSSPAAPPTRWRPWPHRRTCPVEYPPPDRPPKAPQRAPGAPCPGSCSPSTTLTPARHRPPGGLPPARFQPLPAGDIRHGEGRSRAHLSLYGRDDRHQTAPDRIRQLAGVTAHHPLHHRRARLSWCAPFPHRRVLN